MALPLPEQSPRLVTPAQTHVGWIGTGIMGAPMCQHLQANQYRLTLYTRNRSKASLILAKGATWADSPRAVAEQTEVVVTMVGFPRDVRDVYFGKQGILAGTRPGMVLIILMSAAIALIQLLVGERKLGRRKTGVVIKPIAAH